MTTDMDRDASPEEERELIELQRRAAAAGLSLSEYLRTRARQERAIRERRETRRHAQRAEHLAASADELPLGSAERLDVLLSALVATQVVIMRRTADLAVTATE